MYFAVGLDDQRGFAYEPTGFDRLGNGGFLRFRQVGQRIAAEKTRIFAPLPSMEMVVALRSLTAMPYSVFGRSVELCRSIVDVTIKNIRSRNTMSISGAMSVFAFFRFAIGGVPTKSSPVSAP